MGASDTTRDLSDPAVLYSARLSELRARRPPTKVGNAFSDIPRLRLLLQPLPPR